jgi:hypothetical protein
MYSIKIPTPCHEDWNKMTPTDKGAFCKSCAKEVVDFSVMKDEDVLQFLIRHKGQSVCGRATTTQLDKFHLTIDEKIIYSNIRVWKKYLAILLICFGSFLVSCKQPVKKINKDIGKTQIVNTIDTTVLPILNFDTLKQNGWSIPTPPPPPFCNAPKSVTVGEMVVQGDIYIEPVEPEQRVKEVLPLQIDSPAIKKDSTKFKVDSCGQVFS